MTFSVDFPPLALNPNKLKRNFRAKARLTKSYRRTVMILTRMAKPVVPTTARIELRLDFYPPTMPGPVWDDDNMESAFKGGRDGIADALGINDRRFKVTRTVHPRDPACPLGRVEVALLPLTD